MKTLKFDNGDTMHAIGLGTWKATGNDVKKAVKEALYAGYRHIDTAAVYGNEEEIGVKRQMAYVRYQDNSPCSFRVICLYQ